MRYYYFLQTSLLLQPTGPSPEVVVVEEGEAAEVEVVVEEEVPRLAMHHMNPRNLHDDGESNLPLLNGNRTSAFHLD